MRTQNLRKTPHLVERVVERSGCDADDVRFAEIAFYAGGLEFLEQFFWMFVRQDRQLVPAPVPPRHARKFVRREFVQ